MKCNKCGYIGRGSRVYLSSTDKQMIRCPICHEYTEPALERIKGYCKDCYWYASDEQLGKYCFKTVSDVDPNSDYCSKWISIEEGNKLPFVDQK